MLTPLLGKLGDMYGKKRMLVSCLAVFGLGSLAAALGDSLAWLVACRVVQGAGAAVFPLSFGIIRDEFPRERIGIAIGLVSSAFGMGGGIGLVGSGFVLDNLSWQWLFVFGGAPVLVAAALILASVPESPVRRGGRPDFLGAGVFSRRAGRAAAGDHEGRGVGLVLAADRRAVRSVRPAAARPGSGSSAACPSRWSTSGRWPSRRWR